jgi:starch phosphorylase
MATDATGKARAMPDTSTLHKTQYGCGPMQFVGRGDTLYERHLFFDSGVDPSATCATGSKRSPGRCDILSQRWILIEKTYRERNPKRLYYLSMEFLIGCSPSNKVMNLLLSPCQSDPRRQAPQPRRDTRAESDAGLGNGGLGRLAACFTESAATMQLPAMGYGLRYQYGIFRQSIQNGWQHELLRPCPISEKAY